MPFPARLPKILKNVGCLESGPIKRGVNRGVGEMERYGHVSLLSIEDHHLTIVPERSSCVLTRAPEVTYVESSSYTPRERQATQ